MGSACCEASAGAEARRNELRAIERKIENLIEATADGAKIPGIRRRLEELEARRVALQTEVHQEPSPAPTLHPDLAKVSAARVAALRQAMEGEDGTDALEAAPVLVEKVIVSPGHDPEGPPNSSAILSPCCRPEARSPAR